MQAEKLLGPEVVDVDGIPETGRGTISIFNGPAPTLEAFPSEENEISALAAWLKGLVAQGLQPEETGVFVRSEAQLPRARAALQSARLAYKVLD